MYRVVKVDTSTEREINYGGGHAEKDVRDITRGYRYNGLFYERRGSKYIYIVTEE